MLENIQVSNDDSIINNGWNPFGIHVIKMAFGENALLLQRQLWNYNATWTNFSLGTVM